MNEKGRQIKTSNHEKGINGGFVVKDDFPGAIGD